MNQVIRTGFQPITHNIVFDPEKIENGKKLAKLHIRRVEELQGFGACKLIQCSCVRSTAFSEPPYPVKLELNNERQVTHASCGCLSGLAGKCKHIYGLIHRINTERSETRTSFQQEWDHPSDKQLGKDIYAHPLVLSKVYIPNNNFANIKPYEISVEDLKDIDCPLRRVLHVETMNRQEILARAQEKIQVAEEKKRQEQNDLHQCVTMLLEKTPKVDQIYCFNLPELELGLKNFYYSKIHANEKQIFDICVTTVNQSQNSSWFETRNTRISASSRAHKVKTRIRKASAELAKDFFNADKITKSTVAQKYGTDNEKKAVKEYSETYNKKVVHIGVFIMPQQPWLCGSADGVIVENNKITKILEVKCPFTCKSKPVRDSKTGKFNVGYLTETNGVISLKESHQYYTQCQILMYISGLNHCDLYVYSPNGSQLVSVLKDEEYLRKNIPKIQEFYFNNYLPVLFSNEKENVTNNSN